MRFESRHHLRRYSSRSAADENSAPRLLVDPANHDPRDLARGSLGSIGRQLSVEKIMDQREHLVRLILQREVTGVEQMQLCIGQIA
jgi:hypothetical protein